jgi:hypothetical protein
MMSSNKATIFNKEQTKNNKIHTKTSPQKKKHIVCSRGIVHSIQILFFSSSCNAMATTLNLETNLN